MKMLTSPYAKRMGADRIFFSGGEPSIYLPYIEKVVQEARKIIPHVKINFDTNGYITQRSLKRILSFTTSITYDLKAYNDEVYLALTGASSKPILRNAEYIGRYAKDKLWEYRILVIPKINEDEIRPLTEFIANIDPSLPVCFLAFRPNFALDNHKGATISLMDRCIDTAIDSGLKNVHWSGHTGIPGMCVNLDNKVIGRYRSEGARVAGSYALFAGCKTHPRSCSTCVSNQMCKLKGYIAKRVT